MRGVSARHVTIMIVGERPGRALCRKKLVQSVIGIRRHVRGKVGYRHPVRDRLVPPHALRVVGKGIGNDQLLRAVPVRNFGKAVYRIILVGRERFVGACQPDR